MFAGSGPDLAARAFRAEDPSMRVTLVFPPHASPTYAPLGIACLTAHVRESVPRCELSVRDGNLTAWERAGAETPGGPAWVRYLRGEEGDFYERKAYAASQPAWAAAEAVLTRWGAAVKRHLDTGKADPELEPVLDALAAEVLDTDPELVGFSLLSLGQLPWTLALARRVADRGPDRGRRRVVLGGAGCTAFRPEDVLAACPWVDGLVLGEGEEALARLCSGAPEAEVPGLVRRAGGRVVRNRPAPAGALGRLAAPDFSGLPVGRAFNPTPVLPALYSRGCKWRRCRFCAHNSSYGGYRAKAAAACVDELEGYLVGHGARHFYFADLYVDAPDLEALADELLARRLDLRFHVLGRPTQDYTAARLEKLAAAGCRWISWGVESGSQRLLDVAGKGTRPETVERVLRDSHGAGISNLAMMIYGLPTSTDQDLGQTFGFLERVYPFVDAMTASAFALFERTPFARRAAHYGLAVTGPQEEVRVGGHPVRSRRLTFRETAADGSLRPPRGPVEIGEWQRRRRWLGDVPFLEGVPCEHYLLHVAPLAGGTLQPHLPPTRRAA